MNKQYLLVVLIFFITISTVHAQDTINNTLSEEIQTADNIAAVDLNETLSADENTGTFSDLQELIEDSGARAYIHLEKDYKFDITTDSELTSGITIENNQERITIDGHGHTLDANNQAKMFYIVPSHITLKNIIFINGIDEHFRYGNEGGSIYWIGTYGTVVNCTFIGSTAKDAGGAIYFTGERTDDESTVNIINSTFINNTCSGNGNGAAIYWNRYVTTMNIINSTFINNNGLGSASKGGALHWLASSHVNIINSTFINNSATNGGAINWDYDYNTGNVYILNTEFTGNIGRNGGAIRADRAGNVEIINSTFTNNRATTTYGGGAIYFQNAKNNKVINSTFKGNIALNNGGAIRFLSTAKSSVINSVFTDNQAKNGGAISWENSNDGVISNSIFINNYGSNNTETIKSIGGNILTISDSNFTNSQSKYLIFSSNDLSLSKNIIDKNAFIYLDGESTIKSQVKIIVLENKTIEANINQLLEAIIYDDNNNKVLVSDKHSKLIFIINETDEIDSKQNSNAVWSNGFSFNEYATYIVSAKHNDFPNPVIYSATLIVKNDLPTIYAIDLKRGYNSGIDFEANLTDKFLVPLNNTLVKFIINGKTYDVKTDSNGHAVLNVKLDVGVYNVEIKNPSTNASLIKKSTIVKRLQENKDLNIYYRSEYYIVRAYGDDGNPVGAGEIVSITVNGVTYNIKTDKNGYAKLKINLRHKTYTITSEYKGFKVKNKLKVKTLIKAKKTSKIKKSFKIKITLKGKKVLKNKKLTINFKGKSYKLKTNSKGVAYFKINKNLVKKSKKYRYKINYVEDSLIRYFVVK